MIKSSLEWAGYKTELTRKINAVIANIKGIRGFSNVYDIRKMLSNIDESVTELSKAEVLARRGNGHPAKVILEKVNKEIELLEEYILVAKLIG